MGAQPREPEGSRTIGRAVADEHGRLLRPHKIGRCSARSRITTRGSPVCAGTSRRRGPTFSTSNRSRFKTGKVLTKISPLAKWTTKDVWRYAKAHEIPLLPLYELGYTSVGCEPCTSLPLDPLKPAVGALAGPEARMRDSYPSRPNRSHEGRR